MENDHLRIKMKKLKSISYTSMHFILILNGLVQYSCISEQDKKLISSWEKPGQIVNQIKEPVFPDQTFYLSDFGGIADGVTDNKRAIDSIIEVCSKNGGGKIYFGKGKYLVNGPIHLKSNIHLFLEEGSTIIFGSDPEDYLPVVLTSWEGTRIYNYSPFIYTYEAKNVAITGGGVIDGSASQTWAKWKEIQRQDQDLCRKMNHENTPLEQRIFGDEHFLRPHLIQFFNCENILVDGITITDSPFWCLHTIYSRNIIIRNVQYNAHNYNNDGIDPESCSDVLITNISFDNNDDNIAIKSGRDLEARTLNIPSKNIVIRNCRFKGHNAIAIGSEMSGGVNNVFVEDCTTSGKVINGIYLKGNKDRGGEVRDIFVRNIDFDTTESVILIDSDYKHQGECCPPSFNNIYVDNIKCNSAKEYGISLNGSGASVPGFRLHK